MVAASIGARMTWHAATTEIGKEANAARILIDRGVSIFLPRRFIWRRRGGNGDRQPVERCMVPGYVFFQTPESWADILGVRCIRHVLADENGSPLRADEDQMRKFIKRSGSASMLSRAAPRQWHPGDTAMLTATAFSGRTVTLKSVHGRRWRGELEGLFEIGGTTDAIEPINEGNDHGQNTNRARN